MDFSLNDDVPLVHDPFLSLDSDLDDVSGQSIAVDNVMNWLIAEVIRHNWTLESSAHLLLPLSNNSGTAYAGSLWTDAMNVVDEESAQQQQHGRSRHISSIESILRNDDEQYKLTPVSSQCHS